MKLYATISANKLQNGQNITVKKGQGSNEWLDIKLTIEVHNNVHEIGIVRLQPHIDGYKLIIDRSSNFRHQAGTVYEEIINIKGEKKKGECTSIYWDKTCKGCAFCKREIEQD